MNCPHCHDGLMLKDNYDRAVRTCITCGRSDFEPSAALLANTRPDRRDPGTFEGRGREPSIPVGVIHPAIRRFT